MTRRGFTLIELLMSVIITAIMMTVCFITFNTTIRCWQRSAAVADTVRNAEYALTQVVSGLRKDLDEAAARAVSASPKWEPAISNEGRPAPVSLCVPVAF